MENIGGPPLSGGHPFTTLRSRITWRGQKGLQVHTGYLLQSPPTKKLKSIWDVATVLKHIEAWGSIEHLSRSRLTQRMVMLLAIASARRVSDLCLLRTDIDSI